MKQMDDLLQALLASFREVTRAFYHILREEAIQYDVTPVQIMVIYKLSVQGPVSLGILSESMQISNSTMSGIVDRLVHADLVKRERAIEDRRVIVLKLTEKGQNIVSTAFKEGSHLLSKLSTIGQIPDADINKVLEVHKQIISMLQIKEDSSDHE